MVTVAVGALLVGLVLGVLLGRFWAEAARARWDMRRVWKQRRDYRRGGRGPRPRRRTRTRR